jgi:preprotein translocase subunit SecD
MQTLKPALFTVACIAFVAGCAMFGKRDHTTLRFYEQVSSALPASHVRTVELPKLGLTLSVDPTPTLTENDVLSAEIYNTVGGAAVLLRFDPHGLIALDEMTTRCRGQYIVVMLDGRPVAAWLVGRRLTNGQFLLEGDFTDAEAKQLVDSLTEMSHKRR